jgi:hypothetical protein
MFVAPVLNMWLHSQNVRKRSAQIRRANISSMQQAVGRPAAGVVQHERLGPAPKAAAAAAATAGAADSANGTTIELAALQQQQQQLGAYRTVSDAAGVPRSDQDVAAAAAQFPQSVPASKPGIIPTLQVSTPSAAAMSYSSTSSPTATINSASPFIQEHAVPSQVQLGTVRVPGIVGDAAAAPRVQSRSNAGVSSPNTLGGRINSATGRLFRHFFDHHLLDDGHVLRLLSTSTMHSPQSNENFNKQQQQQQQQQQHRPARSMSMPVRRSAGDGGLQTGGVVGGAGGDGVQLQLQRRSFKFWHTDIIMVSSL